jgi:hypothetical protein
VPLQLRDATSSELGSGATWGRDTEGILPFVDRAPADQRDPCAVSWPLQYPHSAMRRSMHAASSPVPHFQSTPLLTPR